MAAASSKPKYPVPWIASYLIVGFILIIGSIAVAWYLEQFSSQFDYDDPDMQFLERIVVSPEPGSGDFTKLNGGDWQALCLVGWNGDLGPALKSAGIPTTVESAIRSEYEGRREVVNQTEFMLVYVTKTGSAKALRHPHGFAFAREGKAVCTTDDKRVIGLPAGR